MFNCTAFLPYLLEHLNIDANFTGTLMGLRSLTEVPFLLMGGLLLRRFPLPKLLAGVSILLTIEQLCYNFVSTPIAIVLIVLIGGLGSGLYFSTTIEYAFRLAPPELASSAQTFLGMATGYGHGVQLAVRRLYGGYLWRSQFLYHRWHYHFRRIHFLCALFPLCHQSPKKTHSRRSFAQGLIPLLGRGRCRALFL